MATSATSWKAGPVNNFRAGYRASRRGYPDALKTVLRSKYGAGYGAGGLVGSTVKRLRGDWKPVSYGLKWLEGNKKGEPVQREKFFKSSSERSSFLKSRKHRGGVKVYNGKGSSDPTV